MIPPWEIWHITLQFKIKIFQFCAYFWLKLVWNFIQKIPPWEIWHKLLQFKIKFLQEFVLLLLAEIEYEISFKWNTSLKNMTHNTSIPNQNLSNLCLLLAEIRYEISFKRYHPWEILHKPLQFKIIILQICAYCYLKLSMKFSFKWYLLEKYDT